LFLPARRLCWINLKYGCTPCHNPHQKTHYGSPKHQKLWKGLDPSQGRLVVVVKKETNQLYGAVGTVEGLDTTRERAKKTQRHLLNQIQTQCT
jgi:hypothetical protein